MRRHSPFNLVLAAFAVTAAAGAGHAGEAARPRATSADKLCDSYGPGFVPAGSPGNCLKVQERLRVEPHGRRGLSPLEGASAFAPLPLGDSGTLPAHLRLNGDFGGGRLR